MSEAKTHRTVTRNCVAYKIAPSTSKSCLWLHCCLKEDLGVCEHTHACAHETGSGHVLAELTGKEKLEELGYDGVVLFESPSYDDALVGVSSDNRAIYDYDKMVACLVKTDGMSEEDAEDFIEYNTIGALGGDGKLPIVMHVL